jgi:outer membrane protein OmpA-like peptidoglycan-associated protein
MRRLLFIGIATCLSSTVSVAYAQTGGSTKRQDEIAKALTCSSTQVCDNGTAPDSKKKIPVGFEGAFSLPTSELGTESGGSSAPAKEVAKPKRTASRSAKSTPKASAKQAPRPSAEMLVQFDFGSADLTDTSKTEVNDFASVMNRPEFSTAKFVVEGHTDSIGGRESNRELSLRRAQSVVDYLVNHGVDATRLSAKGLGWDQPRPGLARSDPGNRRVECVRVN